MDHIKLVDLKNVSIHDAFWSRYIGLVHDVVIPYQWELMNDRVPGVEKSRCIQNFKIAAGLEEGEFFGMPFQDSDLAKWLEAAAMALENKPDDELEKKADEVIDLLEKAQCADGYLDTYFMLKEPDKNWKNLMEGHELYVAGHFIEAAVAYYKATKKDKLLNIMIRFADLICKVFGSDEGQIKGYPGHQEIELALVKLYQLTKNKKYLETARFFIEERGQEPYILQEMHDEFGHYLFPEFAYFDREYMQTHQPVREQDSAEGHSVRALYMYSAMADLAGEYEDKALLEVCEKLYENIVERRMYITGSIGSASFGERFTCDYDLPNDTNYSESCASIALAMFCQRMFIISRDARYMDTAEQALYNTVTAGMSLTGKEFFYVNPLEVWPKACEKNPTKHHVKTERQPWFACACCPPNIARTLVSLQSYAYQQTDDTIFINMFLSSTGAFELGENTVRLEVKTKYPFENIVEIKLNHEVSANYTIALRNPDWTEQVHITIDGKPAEYRQEKGMLYLTRQWSGNEIITYEMDMPIRLMSANPQVRADAGKGAIMKGPLVYCLESCDNGENLSAISIRPDVEFEESFVEELFGGTNIISFEGKRVREHEWNHQLYRPWKEERESVFLKAIPYCFWNNRGKHEMQVWIRVEK